MSRWKSVKAKQLLAALQRIRWEVAWQSGSHRRLKRLGWPNYTFAFHDSDEVGPALVAQIAKKTGLQPGDLEQGQG
jgi:predicted RNA binding protein YcfA (HicA-like mRNA interferase family)